MFKTYCRTDSSPKNKNSSSITHLHIVPNLCDFKTFRRLRMMRRWVNDNFHFALPNPVWTQWYCMLFKHSTFYTASGRLNFLASPACSSALPFTFSFHKLHMLSENIVPVNLFLSESQWAVSFSMTAHWEKALCLEGPDIKTRVRERETEVKREERERERGESESTVPEREGQWKGRFEIWRHRGWQKEWLRKEKGKETGWQERRDKESEGIQIDGGI